MAAYGLCSNNGTCVNPHCKYEHPGGRGYCKFREACAYIATCPLKHGTEVDVKGPAKYKKQVKGYVPRAKPKPTSFVVTGSETPLEVFQSLLGMITLGTKVLNRISIRILSPIKIRYADEGKFETNFGTDEPMMHLFYKENDKAKAVVYNFPYKDTTRDILNIILAKIRESGQYVMSSEASRSYAWFWGGHILDTYSTVEDMFFTALKKGNLIMKKDDYTRDEWYSISSQVNNKQFNACHLLENWQIINKDLAKKKSGADSQTPRECVICLDSEAKYAIVPCGHVCFCETCKNAMGPSSRCPICRGQMDTTIKVYYS